MTYLLVLLKLRQLVIVLLKKVNMEYHHVLANTIDNSNTSFHGNCQELETNDDYIHPRAVVNAITK